MAMGSGRVFARRASWGVRGLPRRSLTIYLSLSTLANSETARDADNPIRRANADARSACAMSYRGARGMAFVRGESSDTAVKGDKYMWASAPDTQTERMRGLKREADEDAYFDEDDEKGEPGLDGGDVKARRR